MNIFSQITGLIGNYLQLGISNTAHCVADNSNGIEARNNNNLSISNFISAQAILDSQCTNKLDMKQRVVLIEFSFAGVTPPVPGTVTGKYGICHTNGLTYTAGTIYYSDGVTLTAILMYKMQGVCNITAFSGTISMLNNAYYVATTAAIPYGWTLIGVSGNGGGSGITPEGGYYVTVINATGAVSVKGTLVDPSPTIDRAVRLLPTSDQDCVGIVYDTGIVNGGDIRIVVAGWADVLIEAGDTIQRNYWIGAPNTTAGRARCIPSPASTAEHFRECGHVFETKVNTGNTLARCMIHFN